LQKSKIPLKKGSIKDPPTTKNMPTAWKNSKELAGAAAFLIWLGSSGCSGERKSKEAGPNVGYESIINMDNDDGIPASVGTYTGQEEDQTIYENSGVTYVDMEKIIEYQKYILDDPPEEIIWPPNYEIMALPGAVTLPIVSTEEGALNIIRETLAEYGVKIKPGEFEISDVKALVKSSGRDMINCQTQLNSCVNKIDPHAKAMCEEIAAKKCKKQKDSNNSISKMPLVVDGFDKKIEWRLNL
jgi:hypothetical protein